MTIHLMLFHLRRLIYYEIKPLQLHDTIYIVKNMFQ